MPIIGLEPIPLVGLDFKSNVSAIPPDGLQLGRTRTPTLHYERNALPAKLLAFWEWRDSNPQPFGLDLQSNALTNSATLPNAS